jgi:hypothetical protein
MLAARTAPVSAKVARPSSSRTLAAPALQLRRPANKTLRAAAMQEIMGGIAAAGDVDAPIGVVIGG